MLRYPILFSLLFLLCTAAVASGNTRLGLYTIHHSAITTDTLDPEVAASYGIPRSPQRGMVNIAIIEEQSDSLGEAQSARVSVVARNLLGQTRELQLREIHESEAIYYIADFPVSDREHLVFDIEVRLIGKSAPLKAQFEQEFFTR